MEQPPGFINATNPGYVCKLNKALYGLKQSPRAWYTKLSTYMLKCGFQGSKSDTLVFFSNKGSSIIILLIYVDDIIITSSHSVLVNSLINQLHNQFALKDLGSLSYFKLLVLHHPCIYVNTSALLISFIGPKCLIVSMRLLL